MKNVWLFEEGREFESLKFIGINEMTNLFDRFVSNLKAKRYSMFGIPVFEMNSSVIMDFILLKLMPWGNYKK